MTRVELHNVSKVFPGPEGQIRTALDRVSLAVADREFVVMVGPSGAGKSTLLRIIAGLEDIETGSIILDGKELNSVPPQDRDIAMVFQNHALYPHLTARDNLAFGLKLRKLPAMEIERRVREAADLLRLTACLDRRPAALSGGERQCVALGRAFVRHPKVFLFDEPLSNLDLRLREQLRDEILRLHQHLGATTICVTHDQGEAMAMGDRVVVLRDGAIQQAAVPLALYRQPANLFVAGFIGSPPMNFLQGNLVARDGNVWFESGTEGSRAFCHQVAPDHAARLNRFLGREVVLGVRPENIQCAGQAGACDGLATVTRIEPAGAESHLHLVAGEHCFTARVPTGTKWTVNQTTAFRFAPGTVHFFDPITEEAVP